MPNTLPTHPTPLPPLPGATTPAPSSGHFTIGPSAALHVPGDAHHGDTSNTARKALDRTASAACRRESREEEEEGPGGVEEAARGVGAGVETGGVGDNGGDVGFGGEGDGAHYGGGSGFGYGSGFWVGSVKGIGTGLLAVAVVGGGVTMGMVMVAGRGLRLACSRRITVRLGSIRTWNEGERVGTEQEREAPLAKLEGDILRAWAQDATDEREQDVQFCRRREFIAVPVLIKTLRVDLKQCVPDRKDYRDRTIVQPEVSAPGRLDTTCYGSARPAEVIVPSKADDWIGSGRESVQYKPFDIVEQSLSLRPEERRRGVAVLRRFVLIERLELIGQIEASVGVTPHECFPTMGPCRTALPGNLLNLSIDFMLLLLLDELSAAVGSIPLVHVTTLPGKQVGIVKHKPSIINNRCRPLRLCKLSLQKPLPSPPQLIRLPHENRCDDEAPRKEGPSW
ncbi:hypothetical protein FPV67DRAFT_1658175 [Lyophyllum atratum]|nr:hypothetical protein FPV67DRAFT_1658175 [Lyophyllum atratum]